MTIKRGVSRRVSRLLLMAMKNEADHVQAREAAYASTDLREYLNWWAMDRNSLCSRLMKLFAQYEEYDVTPEDQQAIVEEVIAEMEDELPPIPDLDEQVISNLHISF